MSLKQLEPLVMGERIRKSRERLGLTREHLAELLDVTPKFIADIEYGNKGLSLKNFILLIHILGVSADYLLLGDEEHKARLLVCEVKFYLE